MIYVFGYSSRSRDEKIVKETPSKLAKVRKHQEGLLQDALKKYKEPGDFWDKVYGQISSDLQKMETVEGLAKEVVKYAGMGSLEETERCLNEIDVASNSVESFHPFSEFYQQQIAKVPSFDTYKVAAINFTKEKQLASK